MNVLEKVCSEVIKLSKKECIELIPLCEKTTIFNSKLGGVPYIPDKNLYPEIDGEKLKFLAQLNFEELPDIEFFPKRGILQFFISSDENKLWGASDYKKYKIIYHRDIDYSLSEQFIEEIPCDNFPIKDEYILKGKKGTSYININDYKFNDIFMSIYKKYEKTNAEGYWEIENINEEKINSIFDEKKVNCGGNPAFIQDDIRSYNIHYRDSILLMEIPSISNNEINISWGDSGIANFFITKEDLKKENFENTLFYWDCY